MEAVAYTWFNRFAALRYMELHDYLGHGHRVLSSATAGGLPDILAHAADLAASRELPGLDAAHIAELYRLLLVAQCNALSTAMPFLFERIDDETELQLPDDIARYLPTVAQLRLFSGMAEDGVAQLGSPPRAWQEVQANELEAAFWALAQRELGYRPEVEPGLRDRSYRVLVTDFCCALESEPPGTVRAKKRYLLGQGIGTSPKAWCGNTAVTAGTAPDGSYDKTHDYWLTARDAQTKVEVLRMPVRVDLAFTNDF